MAVYTVHEPPPKRYELSADPDRFVFVRDGFSLWALLFGPLWMLRHRMWLVLLGYIIVAVGLNVGLHVLHVSDATSITVGILFALLIGLEAATLRRFTLGRRKWINVGVIVGDDRQAAERRFFDAWTRHGPLPPPAATAPPARPAPSSPDVIGLFPQPDARQ